MESIYEYSIYNKYAKQPYFIVIFQDLFEMYRKIICKLLLNFYLIGIENDAHHRQLLHRHLASIIVFILFRMLLTFKPPETKLVSYFFRDIKSIFVHMPKYFAEVFVVLQSILHILFEWFVSYHTSSILLVLLLSIVSKTGLESRLWKTHGIVPEMILRRYVYSLIFLTFVAMGTLFIFYIYIELEIMS